MSGKKEEEEEGANRVGNWKVEFSFPAGGQKATRSLLFS
jgi:hypothetical protein